MRCKRASVSSSSVAGCLAVVLAALAFSSAPASAKVFLSRQEALAWAFPDADRIEKQTFILASEQVAAIESAARARLETKLVTIFTAWKSDEVQGYAHIDIHNVRTHPAALLIVLEPQGEVRSVRILAFHEPLDYLPREKWYRQFDGTTASDGLRVGGDVHGVVTATLSARVAAASVRRALAYYAVLIANGES